MLFHKNILEVLTNLSLQDYSNRTEIDNVLSVEINDFAIRQFLMKNLYRDEKKEFKWRFNILTLKEKLDNISEIDFSNIQMYERVLLAFDLCSTKIEYRP